MSHLLNDLKGVGKISHFFTVNRPLSILFLVAALLFGLISFVFTPKQYNPEIIRPAFAVEVSYQGATLDEAVDRVVYELVEKIDSIPGVEDIYTDVSDGAKIQTVVIFEVGYDAAKAKLDIISQLQQHSYLARGYISQPTIIEINPETIPVLQIAFGSAGDWVPEVRKKVINLIHELGGVADVSELNVIGGYVNSVVVEVDPVQLSAHGVSLREVSNSLRGSQSRTVGNGLDADQYSVEVVFDGRAKTVEEISVLPVGDGVLLRDVASVYQGTLGDRSYVFYQNKDKLGEVVMLSVAKIEGSSAPVVTKAFIHQLDETLKKPEYSELSYQIVSDDGVTATKEINGLTKNLITSILIVTAVLLLFLSVRAAAVVLVAIPVTLLIVFEIGFLFGQSINRITLFALILSLGLLVDSAIVVVENIYTRLKEWMAEPGGITREKIIAKAVDEIGVGLLLSTATSVIVFLPMKFITGMMGSYMGPIAFFVPVALIVSFIVAIIITPFMASNLLKVDEQPNKLSVFFSAIMDKITRAYAKFLKSVIYNRSKQRIILLGSVGLLLISLILPALALVHFQMLPHADRDQFYVYIDLPVGTNIKTTKLVTADISAALVNDSAVTSVQQFIGTPPVVDFNGLFKGAQNRNQSYQATLRVNLTASANRSKSSTAIVSDLRKKVWTDNQSIAKYARFIEEPPGPPVRASLVAKVSANSLSVQQTAAADLSKYVSGVMGAVDTYVGDQAAVGRVRFDFDQTAATALGVSATDAEEAVALLSGPVEVTEFLNPEAGEYSPILFGLSAQNRNSPNDIANISISNQQGNIIPLQSVLKTQYEVRPSRESFEDVDRFSYVTAEVDGRSIVYVVIDVIKGLLRGEMSGYEVTDWNLFSVTLKTSQGEVVSLRWGGEWEMTLENFRDLGIAMGVALLMVYGLLVAQYRRFDTPAFILVTVPLGLVGILWGFLLLDNGFGILLTATALIGFIALIGLVVNNAIILLEYVERALAAGMYYEQALITAGEARLRPILLTSLTTVLGSLTIASDPVWSGLAWSIVFGLSLSTLLTLVVYPTLLVYFKKD